MFQIISILISASFLATSFAADFMDLSSRRLEKWLSQQGVQANYSPETWALFGEFVDQKIATIEEAEKSDEDKDTDKDLIRGLTSLRTIYLTHQNDSDVEKRQLYQALYRSLASLYENLLKMIYFSPRSFARYLFWHKIRLSFIDEDEWDEALLDKSKASKEAQLLFATNDLLSPLSVTDLTKLSPNEISKLEISSQHPYWLNSKEKRQRADSWNYLENRFAQQINKLEETQKTVADLGIYDFSTARQLLFFDEIKNSATSAKISVKDVYGMKWKLKIGAEEQTEPVVNALYLMAGGRFTDLVYAHHYLSTTQVLILDKSDTTKPYPSNKEEFKLGCQRAINYEELKECYQKSKYHTRIDPFILKTGVITESNYLEFSSLCLPASWKNSTALKEKLVGRSYVVYKGNSLEFQGDKDFFKRLGALNQNSMGNENDRVARAMSVFNLWVKNKDAKVENNKSFLALDENGEWEVWESTHDLGASLGTILFEGKINGLKVGEDFVKVKKPLFAKHPRVVFPALLFFVPKVWQRATAADQKWMARQIVSLTQKDIERAVERSLWPDFMRKNLSARLILRRNRLAEVYGLTNLLDGAEPELDSFEVPMATSTQRKAAAQKYGVMLEELEEVLINEGVIDDQGRAEYSDWPVEEGKVQDCQKSVLIGLMEKGPFPSGLSRRALRLVSDGTLRECSLDI